MWARLQTEALKDLVSQCFAPLSQRAALECLQRRDLGVGRVRLLPKMRGMRQIVNLGKVSVAHFRCKRQGQVCIHEQGSRGG